MDSFVEQELGRDFFARTRTHWSLTTLVTESTLSDRTSVNNSAIISRSAIHTRSHNSRVYLGYHDLGCAKTFALMGKAFAEASLEMEK